MKDRVRKTPQIALSFSANFLQQNLSYYGLQPDRDPGFPGRRTPCPSKRDPPLLRHSITSTPPPPPLPSPTPPHTPPLFSLFLPTTHKISLSSISFFKFTW